MDSARARVLDAYEGFDPKMAALAARFFDNGWIDASVRPGKSPGAFAQAIEDVMHRLYPGSHLLDTSKRYMSV